VNPSPVKKAQTKHSRVAIDLEFLFRPLPIIEQFVRIE
jgi:hypothetical protein